MGAAINGYLSDLKPVQQKDLEEAFSKLPNEKVTPERLLRSEQAAAAEATATNEVDMGNIYIYIYKHIHSIFLLSFFCFQFILTNFFFIITITKII